MIKPIVIALIVLSLTACITVEIPAPEYPELPERDELPEITDVVDKLDVQYQLMLKRSLGPALLKEVRRGPPILRSLQPLLIQPNVVRTRAK